MKIIKMTNNDKTFYPLMGPHLANRRIEKDVGYTLYDDDGKTWLIAVDRKVVKAFCYFWKKTKNHYDIGSCWFADLEDPGPMLRRLVRVALAMVNAGTVTITVRKNGRKDVLVAEGFGIKREMKNFIEYSLEVADAKPGI